MSLHLPHKLLLIKGKVLIHWLSPQDLDTQPGFFRDSVNKLLPSEQTAAITPINELISIGATFSPPNDSLGLIYHSSRCGSTLLCQMLKQHPEVLTIGEAAIIGQVLNHPELEHAERILALKGIFSSFLQWAQSKNKRLIFKLSSWQIKHSKLIAEALPSVPSLLLFREPEPVLESLIRKSPSWLTQCVDRKYPTQEKLLSEAIRIYCEYVHYGSEMTTAPSIAFVDYDRLDDALPAILKHFNTATDSEILERMYAQRNFDAKRRGREESSPSTIAPFSTYQTAQPKYLELIKTADLSTAKQAYTSLRLAMRDREFGTC